MASGSSWTTLEIKVLWYSWDSALRNVEEVTEEHIDMLNNAQLCLKIIGITCTTQI